MTKENIQPTKCKKYSKYNPVHYHSTTEELNPLLSQPQLKLNIAVYECRIYCRTILLDCIIFCRCSVSVHHVHNTFEDLSMRCFNSKMGSNQLRIEKYKAYASFVHPLAGYIQPDTTFFQLKCHF